MNDAEYPRHDEQVSPPPINQHMLELSTFSAVDEGGTNPSGTVLRSKTSQGSLSEGSCSTSDIAPQIQAELFPIPYTASPDRLDTNTSTLPHDLLSIPSNTLLAHGPCLDELDADMFTAPSSSQVPLDAHIADDPPLGGLEANVSNTPFGPPPLQFDTYAALWGTSRQNISPGETGGSFEVPRLHATPAATFSASQVYLDAAYLDDVPHSFNVQASFRPSSPHSGGPVIHIPQPCRPVYRCNYSEAVPSRPSAPSRPAALSRPAAPYHPAAPRHGTPFCGPSSLLPSTDGSSEAERSYAIPTSTFPTSQVERGTMCFNDPRYTLTTLASSRPSPLHPGGPVINVPQPRRPAYASHYGEASCLPHAALSRHTVPSRDAAPYHAARPYHGTPSHSNVEPPRSHITLAATSQVNSDATSSNNLCCTSNNPAALYMLPPYLGGPVIDISQPGLPVYRSHYGEASRLSHTVPSRPATSYHSTAPHHGTLPFGLFQVMTSTGGMSEALRSRTTPANTFATSQVNHDTTFFNDPRYTLDTPAQLLPSRPDPGGPVAQIPRPSQPAYGGRYGEASRLSHPAPYHAVVPYYAAAAHNGASSSCPSSIPSISDSLEALDLYTTPATATPADQVEHDHTFYSSPATVNTIPAVDISHERTSRKRPRTHRRRTSTMQLTPYPVPHSSEYERRHDQISGGSVYPRPGPTAFNSST
ncbi:hypothetical protein CERSUDRAFT_95285 [Gelatoporia subvermispora B]|uniref:Uncharacterized protein n=1 Tax=Ceriporiopsis subvermispora (strain B) TaxID=914234 RepID=M2QJ10_CERS8|nr:hypothetical protein CERSUDRAFT_95285 [Gelatoporia subvermispora B]